MVKSQSEGVDLARSCLYAVVDRKTALYLSGGKTPRELYQQLAQEEQLSPGSVGQIDERFGEPFHTNSNQKMIKESGLLRYFEMRDIPFYPILGGKPREETAKSYDEKIRSLNATFQRNVAILGIGSDGHTAGIPAAHSELSNKNKQLYDTYDLVTDFNDESGKYGERVTITFVGLSMLDILIVLVFGDDKKKALELMFQDGSEEAIPARFYKRPDIAPKTIIITDQ